MIAIIYRNELFKVVAHQCDQYKVLTASKIVMGFQQYIYSCRRNTYLEYRNVCYLGAFNLSVETVETSIYNIHFLNFGLHLYRNKLGHTIYIQSGAISAVCFMYKSRTFKIEPVNK